MSDRAFSNLVADNQYSALGLMLLGTLARVKSILGRLVEDKGMNGGSVESVDPTEVTGESVQEGADAGAGVEPGDDFGEVVKREEILGDAEGGLGKLEKKGEFEESKEEVSQAVKEKKVRLKKRMGPWIDRDERVEKEESIPSKPSKKKRKKGDAFDNLFDSLI
jgi:ribonuclease MRP protein subunit RMP1